MSYGVDDTTLAKLETVEFVMLNVSRAEIEQANVRPFAQFFERLSSSKALALTAMNKIDFVIDGYNDDPRHLFEVPEVVRWLEAAIAAVKYLAFFLYLGDGAQAMRLILTCRAQPERVSGDVIRWRNPQGIRSFMNDQFALLNEFTDEFGIDEVNRPVSEKFGACVASMAKDFVHNLN
jgi:hypothetical protein